VAGAPAQAGPLQGCKGRRYPRCADTDRRGGAPGFRQAAARGDRPARLARSAQWRHLRAQHREALERVDPAGAADYRARAAAYTKQIQAVDDWARKEIASVPSGKRRALASHDSLEYIANTYGITLLTVNGWTNKSEPSAAELAKLARQIQVDHVKALFLDSITDPRVMQRIAAETGAAIGGTLYGDSLSPAGGEADSYIEMLRHDVSTLKAGMLRN